LNSTDSAKGEAKMNDGWDIEVLQLALAGPI
jgi:hypothetical protein